MKSVDKKIPKEDYKKILESIPICCVDLVIVFKKKVLLIYRKEDSFSSKWSIIGGRINKNETIEDAVKRKAFEETGIKVNIIKNLGVFEIFSESSQFNNSIKTGTHSISLAYLVKPVEKRINIKLDKTSSNYKWVDCIDKGLPEYVQKILKASELFN